MNKVIEQDQKARLDVGVLLEGRLGCSEARRCIQYRFRVTPLDVVPIGATRRPDARIDKSPRWHGCAQVSLCRFLTWSISHLPSF